MLFFYIPLAYTYRTRLKIVTLTISWVCIYLVPLYIFILTSNFENSFSLFITSCLLVYNLYEIGYIFNDTETIKKEDKPTLRLNNQQLNYYESHKYYIYILRIFNAILLSTIIYYFHNISMEIIIFPYLILLTYVIYNSIRNWLNLPLHFILVTIRYSSPILITLNTISLDIIIQIIFIFPLLNILERGGEKRFKMTRLQNLSKHRNKTRALYYLVISMLLLFIYWHSSYNFPYQPLLATTLYMFVYRFLSPIVFSKIRK